MKYIQHINELIAKKTAATERLVSRMRRGEGPGFLEAVAYRWRGHVGPREDNDVGVSRGTDLVLWKKRDPVRRLFEALKHARLMDDTDFERMNGRVVDEIADAWDRACSAPYPDESALMSLVYGGVR